MYDISPNPPSLWRHLRDCYDKRFVGSMFVVRSIKARYIQTMVGPAWIILQPAVQVALMTLVFGNMVKVSTGVNYALFALVSMTLWSFISNGMERAASSLGIFQELLTRVRVPALIYPLTSWITAAVDFVVVSAITIVLLCFYHPTVSLLPIAIALMGMSLLSLSLGLVFALASILIKDFKFLLPIITQVLFYCSPVVYPVSRVPANLLFWYRLNPFATFLELYRYGFSIPAMLTGGWITYATVATLAIFAGSLWIYNRFSHRLPDYV